MGRLGRSLAVVVAVCALAVAAPGVASAATGTVIDGVSAPDPLRLDDGTPVTTVAQWEGTRRAELLADFRAHVYGQTLPEPTEESYAVHAEGSRRTVTISLTGPEGTGSFDLRLFLPNGTPKGVFLLIDHRGAVGDDPGQSSGYAPVATVTGAGYAFASFDANQLAPDDPGRYREGVIDLFHPAGQELPADAGRAISAWAWGASRALDYLRTDPAVGDAPVAVVGHSRSGKAALWAGAQDTRFAAVIGNDSGSTGAKLDRHAGEGGESVARITEQFPHWFPPAYAEYAGREDALPVDQHQLLALVAPRTLAVGSATEDANADPEGEFHSYVAAGEVYALYGLGDTGLPSASWPPAADTAFRGPAMSYHLRSGEHGLTDADWRVYLGLLE